MMKMLLTSVAVVALVTTAQGADLPRKAPVMTTTVAPIYNWTGFYIGAHVGGAFWDDWTVVGGTGGSNDASWIAGGQVGFDFQFANSWVIGFEANYSFTDSDTTVTFAGPLTLTQETRGLFSATGRFGFTWGPGLIYAKGGYAVRDSDTTFVSAVAPVAFTFANDSDDGYTIGGGLEYMFAPNWSGKIEYQYYDFDSTTFATPAVLLAAGSFDQQIHTIKLGLNYRFNFGNPLLPR